MAKSGALLNDLRVVRDNIKGGSTINGELARMVHELPRERGLAVCQAIDAVESDLAIVDAAIAVALGSAKRGGK